MGAKMLDNTEESIVIDWHNPWEVIDLPVAQDWAKPFRDRVERASGHQIHVEATRATIEALTRKLRAKKWARMHTSTSKHDGRSDSRYYQSPVSNKFVIRISNHLFPNGQYRGAKDYVVDTQMMTDYTIADMLAIIENDEQQFCPIQHRHINHARKRFTLKRNVV
jgi:hypothetical protein